MIYEAMKKDNKELLSITTTYWAKTLYWERKEEVELFCKENNMQHRWNRSKKKYTRGSFIIYKINNVYQHEEFINDLKSINRKVFEFIGKKVKRTEKRKYLENNTNEGQSMLKRFDCFMKQG